MLLLLLLLVLLLLVLLPLPLSSLPRLVTCAAVVAGCTVLVREICAQLSSLSPARSFCFCAYVRQQCMNNQFNRGGERKVHQVPFVYKGASTVATRTLSHPTMMSSLGVGCSHLLCKLHVGRCRLISRNVCILSFLRWCNSCQ